jgi:hypothetical protein
MPIWQYNPETNNHMPPERRKCRLGAINPRRPIPINRSGQYQRNAVAEIGGKQYAADQEQEQAEHEMRAAAGRLNRIVHRYLGTVAVVQTLRACIVPGQRSPANSRSEPVARLISGPRF